MINTIGGVDITNVVRLRIDDEDSSDYEFSDTKFNEWLAHAVRAYSKERPYVLETTISHVEDQDIYALPSGLERVIECQYRLSFDTNVYEPLEDTTLAGFSTYDWPALDLIRRMLRVKYDEVAVGHWEVITNRTSYAAGKYLVIYPAPDSSTGDFTVRYSATHPLSGSDYFTIPAEHAYLLADLLVSYALKRRAMKFFKNPMDYDAGQTRIRRGATIDHLNREADILEQKVWNALRGTVIAIG